MAGGRPPLFETPEALEQKIEEYFESCRSKVVTLINGDGEREDKTLYGDTVTITGLALYLGFESRQSFYDYEKHDEFSYIIKRARLTVETEYEKRLQSKNPTGSIFALKNMGWDDRQSIKHEGFPAFMNIDPIADVKTHDSATEDSKP